MVCHSALRSATTLFGSLPPFPPPPPLPPSFPLSPPSLSPPLIHPLSRFRLFYMMPPVTSSPFPLSLHTRPAVTLVFSFPFGPLKPPIPGSLSFRCPLTSSQRSRTAFGTLKLTPLALYSSLTLLGLAHYVMSLASLILPPRNLAPSILCSVRLSAIAAAASRRSSRMMP